MERFAPLTHDEGAYLVKLARRAVAEYLATGMAPRPPEGAPRRLAEVSYGVFVTIETYHGPGRRSLRGCIGFPFGYKNLLEATMTAAIEAATGDPRFPPMSRDELDRVVFEVSVLSPMERLRGKPKDYPKMVKVGVHGLYIRWGYFSGLLLPQVPVEFGWDPETFLAEACIKAGLPPDAWLEEGVEVYVFQAQVFTETEPNGQVVERDLLKEAAERGLAGSDR